MITVDVQDQSPSCGHGKVTFTIGSIVRTIVFSKAELLDEMDPEDVQIATLVLLRVLAKAANVTTWAQMKSKFNNRTVTL